MVNAPVLRVGPEPIDNTLYGGSGEMLRGAPKVIEQGNETPPLDKPDRPEPAVEWVFESQREERERGRR
jgi:hypothetical protein